MCIRDSSITLQQVQTEAEGPIFTMPLDIRLIGATAAFDTTIWLRSSSETYDIPVSFEPERLELDPDGWVLMEVVSNTAAIPEEPQIPDRFNLAGNYPNPFNPSTAIQFELPWASNMELMVYDIRGRLVKDLWKGVIDGGVHELIWDGLDQLGRQVPSGLYIARLVTPEYSKSIKMLLLK